MVKDFAKLYINDNDGCNGIVLFDSISITTRGGEVYFDDISFIEKEYISTTADRIYYYHNDHLGTPQVLSDENGQIAWYGDYEPFGKVNILVERTTNNFRFPGQYFIEETGLYYNWNRWYFEELGRYVQFDSVMKGKLFRRIDGFYRYSGNNPILVIDWLGLCTPKEVNEELREIDKKYEEWKREKCKQIKSTLLESCKWWAGRKSQVCADLAFEFAGKLSGRCCRPEPRLVLLTPPYVLDAVVKIYCKVTKCDEQREEERRTYYPYIDLSGCFLFGPIRWPWWPHIPIPLSL